jgi:hypothetical protein
MKWIKRILTLAALSLPLTMQAANCTALTGLEKVVCLTEAFKATLSKEQVALLQLDYEIGNAKRWSNFPQAFARPNRVGLSLASFDKKQFDAFIELMSSVMSNSTANEGLDELKGCLAADTYFGEKTGKKDTFGADHYVIVFLGKPSTTQQWELMFGGHHFAFANTYNHGKITGVTPSFRGVEPITPVDVDSHTYIPLEQEKQAFADVIRSLNDNEKTAAKLSSAKNDILLGPGDDGDFPSTKNGVRIGTLTSDQKEKITKAISLYIEDLSPDIAAPIMAKYLSELDDTYVCYSGSGNMSAQNDYIRLDGPTLWIEYSAQPSRDFPGTTHAHSIWRDRKTDYGGN